MKFREMEVFAAVVHSGSATGAGRLLRISQAAVSSTLKQLEEEVHTQLFVRGHGRLQPTDAGKVLYRSVSKVLAEMSEVRRVATDLRWASLKPLNIAASISLTYSAIAEAVANIMDLVENVRFNVTSAPIHEVQREVLNGKADLGVVVASPDNPYLTSQVLCSGELVCLLPDNHPLCTKEFLTPKDLADYPLVTGGNRGTYLGESLAASFEQFGVAFDPVVQMGSSVFSRLLVSSKKVISLADSFSTRALPPGTVQRALRPKHELNAQLIYRNDLEMSSLHRLFVRELTSVLARTRGEEVTAVVL